MRAIGRKASTDGTGTIIGMGHISNIFQRLGNSLFQNEWFIMLHKTGPKRSAADFIIFRGGSKGPGALFWFIVFSLLTTNSSIMCGSGGPLEIHDGETGGYCEVRLEKKELIYSAI